ncbi:hypothetical protein N8I77_004980 [Diaporthe amygdali]|uniref:Uncharacterized protein n=1 Tax=Phomopsis amygdali TaxID=1214568 RepID=A0AAD9W7L6_PHOAM|nr:hypothetical protein N8I77_004980 [Diaporthe amygdali]
MQLTKFFTLLALGYGAMAQGTPTDPDQSSETVTATPVPPKEPGTSFFCQSSDLKNLDNSEGICNAAGGKYNIFSGCCVDTAASGAESSYTQGCSDNGGTVNKLSSGSCDLAA